MSSNALLLSRIHNAKPLSRLNLHLENVLLDGSGMLLPIRTSSSAMFWGRPSATKFAQRNGGPCHSAISQKEGVLES